MQTNSGPSGGGNPTWTCATCGQSSAAMGPNVLCWCDRFVLRGGLPYETKCLTSADAKEHSVAMIQRGWHCRKMHYGIEVWWRYAPEESTDEPDFERAETYLATGMLG